MGSILNQQLQGFVAAMWADSTSDLTDRNLQTLGKQPDDVMMSLTC